jgi:phosphocarrier protein
MDERSETLPPAGPPDAERRVTVSNQRGLHARAAAKFVKLAGTFRSEITVAKGPNEVPGGSIMGLMMLAAAPGCDIVVAARGPDADDAVAALTALVERKFDED